MTTCLMYVPTGDPAAGSASPGAWGIEMPAAPPLGEQLVSNPAAIAMENMRFRHTMKTPTLRPA